MSVQIQFHITDNFIKCSPDVTTIWSILTMALDILHGNLFRIYERFPKKRPLFFYCINIHIFNYPKLRQLQILKNIACTGWRF